jgi:hypothetical protein
VGIPPGTVLSLIKEETNGKIRIGYKDLTTIVDQDAVTQNLSMAKRLQEEETRKQQGYYDFKKKEAFDEKIKKLVLKYKEFGSIIEKIDFLKTLSDEEANAVRAEVKQLGF